MVETSVMEGGEPSSNKVRSDMIEAKPNMSLRIISLDNEGKNASKQFLKNYIRTTKYTLFSFVPLGLFYQFMRLSNCYFLLVTIL